MTRADDAARPLLRLARGRVPVGMHLTLQCVVGAIEHRRIEAEALGEAKQLEMVAEKSIIDRGTRRKRAGPGVGTAPVDVTQTLKDSPQPQASLTLGLLNLKPSFRPSRAKSSSVPSRNGRLFGSTTTVTP